MEKTVGQPTRNESKTMVVERVRRCLHSGDYSRALDSLRDAAVEFATDTELSELQKLAQDGIKRKTEADLLITESQDLFAQGKSAAAIQLLRKAHELDKKNSLARAILANSLVEHAHSLVETDWLQAETLANQALALNPAHPTAKTVLNLIVEQKEKSSVEDWVSQARKLQSSGDLFAALAWVAEGLAVHPHDSKLLQIQDEIQRDQEARRRQARRGDLEDLRRLQREIDGATDVAAKQALAERIQNVAAKYWTDGEVLSIANALLLRLGLVSQDSASSGPRGKATTLILHVPRHGASKASAAETSDVGAGVTPSAAQAGKTSTAPVLPSQIPPNQIQPSKVKPSQILQSNDLPSKVVPAKDSTSIAQHDAKSPAIATQDNVLISAPELQQSSPATQVTTTPVVEPPPAAVVTSSSSSSQTTQPAKSNLTSLILVAAAAMIVAVAVTLFFARRHYSQPLTENAATAPAVTAQKDSEAGDSTSTAPVPAPAAQPAAAPAASAPAQPAAAQPTPEPSSPVLPAPSHNIAEKAVPDKQVPAVAAHDMGTLLVIAGQDNAQVLLNGKVQRQLTSAGQLRIPNLDVKDYVVQVSKSGFQDTPEQKIRIRKDEQARLVFNLQPQVRLASLTIRGGAPGTMVLIDQAPAGTIQADGSLSVSAVNPGDHTVELRKEKFKPRQLKEHFVAGAALTLAASDAALEAIPGELKITFTPADARVAIVKGDFLAMVSSGVPLNLAAGTYTLTARTADRFTRSSTLEVGPGQSRSLDLPLAPNGMSKWDDPSAWKQDKDSFIRKGGDFVLYSVAPASGTFVFSAIPAKGHVLQWVLNYTDSRNYILFQMDDSNFYRAVIRNGQKSDEIKAPDKSDRKSLRTLHIRVSATEIVHEIKDGNSWTVVDRWTQAGSNLGLGKFGFYLPGNDQIEISGFAHYADLNIR
jgi:tetratricopeptide (TPR) repeat protein